MGGSLIESNFRGVIAIACWAIGFVAIALVAPEHTGAVIVKISRSIAVHVESVEGYAQLSLFPEKTRQVLLLTWATVPLLAAYCYRPVRRILNVDWIRSHSLLALAIVLAILGTAALVIFSVPEPGDLETRNLIGRMLRRMSRSQIALGIVGATWSLGLGFGLAVAAAACREMFSSIGKYKSGSPR